MVKRIGIIFLFSICCKYAFSQKHPEIRIRLNALAIADIIYPTIQPGIEIKMRNCSILYTHGFKANYFFAKAPDSANAKINKNKIELRYYAALNLNPPFFVFFGLQLFNTLYTTQSWNGTYGTQAGYIHYDYAIERKTINGIAISSGYIIENKKKNLSLEYSGGAGIRFINTQYDQVRNPVLSYQRPHTFGNINEGNRVSPHLFTNLAVLYKINRSKNQKQ